MSWTDERVDVLKKLWMEGLSASQIAGELGQGVTRNAVIGKVHRLKLSGRAKPATSSPRARAASRPARRASGSPSPSAGVMKRRTINSAPMIGATALKQSVEVDEQPMVAVVQEQELFIPIGERVDLLSLSEQTCKWPIGDPLNDDFHFCGRNSLEAKPYCEFHSRRAYHTMDRKRR